MTKSFNKGDIIQGAKRNKDESYHPIIYFGEIDGSYFLGGMITHSRKFGNVELNNSHFDHKISHDNQPSYFVKNYLIKKHEWGPYRLIGNLSDVGVRFIESNLKQSKPEIWENYLTK